MVGRFVGALASKHYRYMILESILNGIERIWIFNLLLYPYERAIQYTGDQLGLVAMDGDIEPSLRATCKLMAGSDVGALVNYAGVLEQRSLMNNGFFNWVAQCLSPFPHTVFRLENLIAFNMTYDAESAEGLAQKHGIQNSVYALRGDFKKP